MLSIEDNRTLSRVGPGTPMGDLMRRYWLPLLYGWELENDGPPQRVRLLGEDMIAYRTSSGEVGLIAESCPHRGASLFFGRNEEDGLRCVYHGWKFDVAGACVDMPSEPAESNFKTKVRANAYAAAEQGGIIWAYMGPDRQILPAYRGSNGVTYPEEQRHHQYKGIYECNWMQALEGDIDTSHLFLLHARLEADQPDNYGVYHPDKAPHLDIIDTDYGIYYGASRKDGPSRTYWRTTQYLFPIFTMFPGSPDGTVPQHMYTPIDDNTTLHWGLRWHPTEAFDGPRELNQDVRKLPEEHGMGPMKPAQGGKPFPDWWPVADDANDYLMDREVQRTMNFTGIPTIRLQDVAMTVSMGGINPRHKEHLGTTDTMIIMTRRKLIRAARALREAGTPPPGSQDPSAYRRRSCSTVLPAEVIWHEALADWHAARTTQVPTDGPVSAIPSVAE